MNARVKNLFDEAGKLSPEEREALARMLLASLDDHTSLDAAWGEEADRLWAEHIANGEETVDAFEAIDEARALLRRGRTP